MSACKQTDVRLKANGRPLVSGRPFGYKQTLLKNYQVESLVLVLVLQNLTGHQANVLADVVQLADGIDRRTMLTGNDIK